MTDNRTAKISVEDRLALMELSARYAMAIDKFEIEPLMELFTEDAVFDESRVGTGKYVGREEVRKFFEHCMEAADGLTHLITNFIVHEVDGDTARGEAAAYAEGDIKDGGRIFGCVRYEDVYARTETGWRFRERAVIPLGSHDTSAIANFDTGILR